MHELVEALDGHVKHNGVEVEVQLMRGAWDDVRNLVTPYAEAWKKIGERCNTDALDEDEVRWQANGFIAGRSSLAHEILRMIAEAERKVQER